MDSGFATSMKSAVEELKSAFSTFTSGTITEAVWNGDAADNARNQITEKIDPKVEEVEAELDNLVTAIGKATEAEELQEQIESKQTEVTELQGQTGLSNDVQTTVNSQINSLQSEITSLQEQLDGCCDTVKRLCSY